MALLSYTGQNQQPKAAARLLYSGIATRLQKQVGTLRDNALKWNWQLALIDAPVGLELAARAGCNPNAAIAVRNRMAAAQAGRN